MINQIKPLNSQYTKYFERWSVDRYGRLFSGAFMTIATLLGIINVYFLSISIFIGLIFIVTSITDKCLMRDLLLYLGAKEREDLFLPGGIFINDLKSNGVPAKDKKSFNRKATATSQALIQINKAIDAECFNWSVNDITNYKIKMASNIEDRKKVYRLAQKIYSDCGYANDDKSAYCVLDYDTRADTVIFAAEDLFGNIIGSITVVTNQIGQLPCEEIFEDELSKFKNRDRVIVEITRLVIDKNCSNSKNLVKNLMNGIYIYANSIVHASDIIIEVNPRHKGFYEKLLCFELFGNEKPCCRVKGAPAVLMRLPIVLAEMKVLEGRGSFKKSKRKCLFHHFVDENQESNVVEMIRQTHRPMSESERQYFGLIKNQDLSII